MQGRGGLGSLVVCLVVGTWLLAVVFAGPVSAADGGPDSAQGSAAAKSAANGEALQKAREALQKAREALNKARFAVNKNRATRQEAALAQQTADQALTAAANAAKDAAAVLGVAQQARSDAKDALAAAADAAAQAATALADAQAAQTSATQANDRLDATETVSDTEGGTITTTEKFTYELHDGPQVSVTVPASGLIEVWASVTFGDGVEDPDGLVALFEDGVAVPIPGQDGICGSPDIETALISAFGSLSGDPLTLSTPPSGSTFGLGCGTIGAAPAPVLLQSTPGPHTFELGYAWGDCGCSTQAVFSDRTLTVAPRP